MRSVWQTERLCWNRWRKLFGLLVASAVYWLDHWTRAFTRRGSVVGTSVFGWRTFPDLRL